MAEGNPYYLPRPSFFEEFSKGVGLGLSLRQASDRAKKLELETQQQQMAMEEMKRQRTLEEEIRRFATTPQPTGAMEPTTAPGVTIEEGGQFPSFGQQPQGYQAPAAADTGLFQERPQVATPKLSDVIDFTARRGADPKTMQALAAALQATQKQQAPQFLDVPGMPGYKVVQAPNGSIDVIRPQSAQQGNVTDQIVRQLATDPATGTFDAAKAQEILKNIRTNPQGAEGRITDYLIQRNTTGKVDPAMEKTIADYQNFIRGKAITRAAGAEVGKEQGLQEIVGTRLQRLTQEETAKNAGRPLPDSAQTAITAMQDGIMIASQLKDDFTPEERRKYVGILRLPATRVAQYFKEDPRFAEFNALLKRSEGTAFGEGGKQLTGIEKDVVFGYIPTGREISVVDFEAKLDQAINMGEVRIRNRYEVARAGKGSPGENIPALNRPNQNRPRPASPRRPSNESRPSYEEYRKRVAEEMSK